MLRINERDVSHFDLVTSAWVMPENLRYQIIRERHDRDDNLAYTRETSRVIVAMAQAAGELVEAKTSTPAADQIQRAIRWYDESATPTIKNIRKSAL